MSPSYARPDPQQIKHEALAALADAMTEEALKAWRATYLGRKGIVTAALRSIGKRPSHV